SLKAMTTPFKSDYACGLFGETKEGRKTIQHGGGIEGFNTQLTYYPDDKLTVVVLGNVNGMAPTEIVAKLSAIAHEGCLWRPRRGARRSSTAGASKASTRN